MGCRFSVKKIIFIFLLTPSFIFSQECLQYEDLKKTFKLTAAIYSAVGVLKSSSCNESSYAENKRKFFFEKMLTPGMVEDVENGKYPKRCSFVLTDAAHNIMKDQENKKHKTSLCQEAKALLDFIK